MFITEIANPLPTHSKHGFRIYVTVLQEAGTSLSWHESWNFDNLYLNGQ